MYEVVQGTVVVLTLDGGSAVVAIAISPEIARTIAEGLRLKAAERAIDG